MEKPAILLSLTPRVASVRKPIRFVIGAVCALELIRFVRLRIVIQTVKVIATVFLISIASHIFLGE